MRLIDAESEETIENIVFVICKDFDVLNREYVRISVEEALERTKTAFDIDKVLYKIVGKMQKALSGEDRIRASAFAEAIAIVQKGGMAE